jgi:hypothetical protein
MRVRTKLCFALTLMAAIALLGSMVAAATGYGGESQGRARSTADQSYPTVDRRSQRAPDGDFARLAATARRDGSVRVIVGLQTRFTPEGVLSGHDATAQHAAIRDARRHVLSALHGTSFR